MAKPRNRESSKATFSPDMMAAFASRVTDANLVFMRRYPGERVERQPAHTVYIAGDAFHEDLLRDHSEAARRAIGEHAPDAATFARILDVPEALAQIVRPRVIDKLVREPIEDLRLDFEDGYGVRPDAEEDAHAAEAAERIARALAAKKLSPFFGIRVKPLNEDVKKRSLRTLDVFLTTLAHASKGAFPRGLVLTLAKVTSPVQVAVFADALAALEEKLGAPAGTLRFEIMIEVAQAVLDDAGRPCVRALVDAGRGRCVGAHLGTYDFTASLGVTAAHQHMGHPACDFAKQVMQVSLAGTGVFLSDGSTNVLPIPKHAQPANEKERRANHMGMLDAWQRHARDVQRSLVQGFYQGWDLHPAQLVTRFGALYAFFLDAVQPAAERMSAFVSRASHASEEGGVADDAATGQALLNFFLRGMSCGAITEEEAAATGLTLEEFRGRSFTKVLAARARKR